jgi:uncharacterized protein YcbX
MSLELASIHVYPVKSLGGFAVEESQLTDRGLEHDRRWMLVNEKGSFLTQRELPMLACLHLAPTGSGFRITDMRDNATLELPWAREKGVRQKVTVFDDHVEALYGPPSIDAWFSDRSKCTVHLVYMPATSHRPVDAGYAERLNSFSDGFPYLIISQASLDDLNARLTDPVGMERFRPNLVIAGGTAFQEDGWSGIDIGTARFELVKPCGRCVITTVDQQTGERGKEPLRTLSIYRSNAHKVLFGMNAVGDLQGTVRVGDAVHIGTGPST